MSFQELLDHLWEKHGWTEGSPHFPWWDKRKFYEHHEWAHTVGFPDHDHS